jgi:hypothetical protein
LLAKESGFSLLKDIDLTDFLRPYYSKSVLAALKILTRIPFPTAFWNNLVGGVAIQVCLMNRWIRYRLLVFQKLN